MLPVHRSAAGRPGRSPACAALSLLLLLVSTATGYDLDTSSADSVKSVASSMAEDMVSFYNGNKPGGTPGLLPTPYYWWEAGAMLGALVDYWYYTGDTQYNDLVSQGLLFQVGPNSDYMPPNQTLTEGNDDQGFWGLSVMTAAEYNFPNPPADKPQWLALAQAVFNTQAARWDAADCQGGLRWQIFTWNTGYDYKNSISQACFFNLAARLLLYTGNTTYNQWAVETWDWMAGVKLLDDNYYVYDGAHIGSNCTDITPYQWSYNAGAFLLGAAAMYNHSVIAGDQTAAAMWRERVDGLLNGTHVFFTGNNSDIMTEVACEAVELCDLDQQSFKAYLSRWMAATTKWAPWTAAKIMPLLQTSAEAAASQCTGGDNGRMCGLRWTEGSWDGSTGVGQQMAAMEVTLANMISDVSAPVTNSTGGTSQGDPNAGGSDIGRTNPLSTLRPITTGDRVGAGILTALFGAGLLAGVVYMLIDETVDQPPKERWTGFVAAVGQNSRRLAKRGGGGGGDGPDGILSEKGKQPRVQSFRIASHADSSATGSTSSDQSAGSIHSNDGSYAQGQGRRSAQFANQPAAATATGLSDPEKGGAHRTSHHSFFSPAHFRHLSAGTGARTDAASRPPARFSDPGVPSVVQYPQTAVRASRDAPVEQAAPRQKHFIRRKPTS